MVPVARDEASGGEVQPRGSTDRRPPGREATRSGRSSFVGTTEVEPIQAIPDKGQAGQGRDEGQDLRRDEGQDDGRDMVRDEGQDMGQAGHGRPYCNPLGPRPAKQGQRLGPAPSLEGFSCQVGENFKP